MIDACREHSCRPLLVVWPDQRQLLGRPTWRPPYQAQIRQIAAEEDIPCLDLVPLFEEAGAWGLQRFLLNDVVHLDDAGNRLVAEAIRKLLDSPGP